MHYHMKNAVFLLMMSTYFLHVSKYGFRESQGNSWKRKGGVHLLCTKSSAGTINNAWRTSAAFSVLSRIRGLRD
jgi:hypothetical protein